jgi:hypothetical protein
LKKNTFFLDKTILLCYNWFAVKGKENKSKKIKYKGEKYEIFKFKRIKQGN